jgi:hypothetical protein
MRDQLFPLPKYVRWLALYNFATCSDPSCTSFPLGFQRRDSMVAAGIALAVSEDRLSGRNDAAAQATGFLRAYKISGVLASLGRFNSALSA